MVKNSKVELVISRMQETYEVTCTRPSCSDSPVYIVTISDNDSGHISLFCEYHLWKELGKSDLMIMLRAYVNKDV